MMHRLMILVSEELKRLVKYRVITVSFIVTLIWAVFIYFMDGADIFSQFLPIILMIDATMMSVIYVGAIMFYEKTESTISTMLVTPVSNKELVISKAVANTIHSFISCILVVLVFHIIKGVQINWLLMSIGLLISIFFHSLLGFVFSFNSKNFTSMLVNVMIYNFLFVAPTMLHALDIFLNGVVWEYVLLFTPPYASINLIMADFTFSYKTIISFVLLLLGIILGMKYYILPKFKEYAVKQSGV